MVMKIVENERQLGNVDDDVESPTENEAALTKKVKCTTKALVCKMAYLGNQLNKAAGFKRTIQGLFQERGYRMEEVSFAIQFVKTILANIKCCSSCYLWKKENPRNRLQSKTSGCR